MPAFFASDVHLRLDHPERGRRFAGWVDTLDPADPLFLVGDVCDFWFSSRECNSPEGRNEPGLASLARFYERGGRITILGGNHDAWIGQFYRSALGARFIDEDVLDIQLHGLRLRLLHGHKIKAGGRWKGVMESWAFYRSFQALPSIVASQLDRRLQQSNSVNEDEVNRRNLMSFGQHAETLAGRFDLVIFGHVHQVYEQPARGNIPRWCVLGNWHSEPSFLRIDEGGARLFAGGMELAAVE